MSRILLCLVCLGFVVGRSHGQDFDSDFRICDGLPASQRAFALALGGGDLKLAAANALKSLPVNDLAAAIHKLFQPAPNTLTQLNARVDAVVSSVDLATQLQMQFNQIVASRFKAASADNIVCSMSLLSYREASDVFGKRVANQYGVVQLTIRNTDSAHEFLLHQVDFWFGDTLQYYASRDRKIARGVAEKGQVVDPRNLTVRILEGIGSVAGPITNVFSNDAQLASSIFNSSFIPALKTAFPDLTVQQIGRLDDMGFSAGASTMVIPKNGAISLVAFIPADSFLIPKLAQYETYLDSNSPMGKQLEDCSKWQDTQLANAIAAQAAGKTVPQDTQMSDICDKVIAGQKEPAVGALSSQSIRSSKGKSTKSNMTSVLTLGMHTNHKNIGAFDGAVVLLLQKDLHMMVSGSHIQELTTQLAVTSVTCSMPSPLVSDSVVNCALAGNSLNSLTQGRLINQTDSTFSVLSNGLKTSKDDPAHGQISFPGCSFAGKPSTNYVLEVSSSGGAMQLNAFSQMLTPNSFTCSRASGGAVTCQLPSGFTAQTVTLTGSDKVAHNGNVSGSSISIASLASGTYSVSAATNDGKTTAFCPVTF